MTRPPSAAVQAFLWCALLALGITATLTLLGTPRDPGGALDEGGGHTGGVGQLIPMAVDRWSAVEIAWRGELHRFARDPAGAWYLDRHPAGEPAGGRSGHTHRIDTRAAARIDKAFGMLGRARIERVVERGALDRAEYGVAHPPLIVMLYAGGARPVLTLNAGELAPDRLSRYLHLVERRLLVTIPDYHVANLLALLASFGSGP